MSNNPKITMKAKVRCKVCDHPMRRRKTFPIPKDVWRKANEHTSYSDMSDVVERALNYEIEGWKSGLSDSICSVCKSVIKMEESE